jgi:hypothetical protein
MLHRNQNPQRSFRCINCLRCYTPPTKSWIVEIFKGRSSELHLIGGGPASKNKLIQHDQIVRLKRSTNSGVAAAMSGFSNSAG